MHEPSLPALGGQGESFGRPKIEPDASGLRQDAFVIRADRKPSDAIRSG